MLEQVDFPYLLLLISGGHTQLVWVEELGCYRRLGTTIDDAAGEAFDKTAKLLQLGLPGGPRIEAVAGGGRADRFDFPKPLEKRAGCDFSFSGLKTAIREAAAAIDAPTTQDIADLAAAFQMAAARHLVQRTANALDAVAARGASRLVVAGGVAANGEIKSALGKMCESRGWTMIVPPPEFCTDNGAMVAWAAAERFAAGKIPPNDESLAASPRARWPLASPPEGREIGGGRKGPRA
jgi:N6-L-threonylcarbamoyladenine synthase